jgi:hypothetical protein
VIVAAAKETRFKVLREKTAFQDQIDDLLQKGSQEDVLKFIQTKNILNPNVLSFADIHYLLRDKEFFLKLLAVLRRKRVFDYTTWSYSLLHHDHTALSEFLNCPENQLLFQLFKHLHSSLIEVVNARVLEYYPFVTPRVHHLSTQGILNVQCKQQYQTYVQYLIEKGTENLTTLDRLTFIYYLLLQERIDDAIKVFRQIPSGATGLQYDYFAAYLDFYIGFPNFQTARTICDTYLDYPIIHWRNLFYEVANQLAEYDGDALQESQQLPTESTNKTKQN